jgi:hypothetical protein
MIAQARKRYMREDDEQAELFRLCGYMQARVPELGLLFAIPNGEERPGNVGAKLQGQGVKAGVPDMFLPVARGEYHGLFIELKTFKRKAEKNGGLQDNQVDWAFALAKQNYRMMICYGWEEAWRTLEEYLGAEMPLQFV